jgi:hypothetical protein
MSNGDGAEFQQHNSSSKIDGKEMRRGGVSFIPKEAKRGESLMAAMCWQSKGERGF